MIGLTLPHSDNKRIAYLVYLLCDNENCFVEFPESEDNYSIIRVGKGVGAEISAFIKLAEKNGWQVTRRLHRCPRCKDDELEEPEAEIVTDTKAKRKL